MVVLLLMLLDELVERLAVTRSVSTLRLTTLSTTTCTLSTTWTLRMSRM